MTAETSNARGEVVAWFPTNAQGEIIRNYGDGSPVYACRTKEEAEQAKRCHLGATGPVIPLYAAPPPAAARVDVTWPLSILEAGNWREVYMGTKHMRLEVSYPYEAWERLMAALAAAQQQEQAAPPSAPDYPITATCRVCDCDYRCVPIPAKCGACGADLPPSAPVGVEDVVMAARNAENAIRNCAAAGQIGEGYVQYADDLRDAVQRLAQQPAAVDEAMVERATTAYLQSRGTYEGEVPVDRDDMRAALTAALATKHQEPKKSKTKA
jgi:hypothetical protein